MAPTEIAATGAEVRDLITALGRLEPVVGRLSHKFRFLKGVVWGLVGVVVSVAVVATIAGITAVRVEGFVTEREDDRLSDRAAACIQFNVQRFETREVNKKSILTFAPDAQFDIAKLTGPQRALYDAYARVVNEGLPFRDCSVAGLDAYFKSPPKDPALG